MDDAHTSIFNPPDYLTINYYLMSSRYVSYEIAVDNADAKDKAIK